MHLWIGYSKGFNQAKYNEECTVYSGVFKCFEVGANSGKAGSCDNQGCLSQATTTTTTITLFKEGSAITYYSFLTYGPQFLRS